MVTTKSSFDIIRMTPTESISNTSSRKSARYLQQRSCSRKVRQRLWAVDPSGDAARKLLNFFKEIDPEVGGLKHSFATKQAKTSPIVEVYEKLAPQAQFLGDLYQDLSEHARKKYALLQTPEFIQKFILDRTLTQAIDQFRIEEPSPHRPGLRLGPLFVGCVRPPL